jgi:hypothetical protein
MRKEIIIAIILGLAVGLSITYVFYQSQDEEQTQVENVQLETTPEPSITDELSTNLSVLSPEDESITDQEEIKVAGNTFANAFVVILVNNQEYITQTDETGNFSTDVTLETGSNILQVNSISEDGVKAKKEVTTIYTTQELKLEDASSSAKVNTENEDET